MRQGTATFIDIILAIILPPLGVFLKFGCHVEFWICLLLTFLGYGLDDVKAYQSFYPFASEIEGGGYLMLKIFFLFV
ncbi:hypothetical protein AgCh_034294 [Apium graveolens]